VSTLEAYFNGEKELFHGLEIEPDMLRDDFETYPVLRFDMSDVCDKDDVNKLNIKLLDVIQQNADCYGIKLKTNDPNRAFSI
jgi:hypothetical protein